MVSVQLAPWHLLTIKETSVDNRSFSFRKNRSFSPCGKFKTFICRNSSDGNNSNLINDDASKNTLRVEFPLPRSAEESVVQARAACQRAIKDGEYRLLVDLLLPLIGATDLDDWPGGIQQQFKAASPLISSLLSGLVGSEPFGGCRKSILDDGDAVVAWESSQIALVLFATAETLSELEALSKDKSRPLIMANPQWQGGQVISDFGFGSKREAAEAFVNSFTNVYTLKRIRVSSHDVRLLKCYPGDWQVFIAESEGGAKLVSVEKGFPKYKRLEELVRKFLGSEAPQSWLERLKTEFKFNQDSLKG